MCQSHHHLILSKRKAVTQTELVDCMKKVTASIYGACSAEGIRMAPPTFKISNSVPQSLVLQRNKSKPTSTFLKLHGIYLLRPNNVRPVAEYTASLLKNRFPEVKILRHTMLAITYKVIHVMASPSGTISHPGHPWWSHEWEHFARIQRYGMGILEKEGKKERHWWDRVETKGTVNSICSTCCRWDD